MSPISTRPPPKAGLTDSTISKLILSTGNIMASGPSLIGHRPLFEKSNIELTNSLRTTFASAKSMSHSKQGDQTSKSPSPQAPGTDAAHSWASASASILSIPSPCFTAGPLMEPQSAYDITAKLFFLPSAYPDAKSRTAHAQEALRLVLKTLEAQRIDLLIVSYPGISFDADDGSDTDSESEALEPHEMPPLNRTITAENRLVDSVSQSWRGIEELYNAGLVSSLGVAEFGSERLERFLPRTSVRPSVDQINVRDCCVVPKSLILYAKEKGIQLLTHNDCTDILPPGTVREILEDVFRDDDTSTWLQSDIVPQWVIKYTAVVRDRGVIENKGYFAMAEVHPL